VLKEPKVRRDRQQEHKVLKVMEVQQEHKVHKVLIQVHKELKVFKE
jgi:hypothetical protein